MWLVGKVGGWFKVSMSNIPYSAKRWRRKTLANQQNIALAKKTLANRQLGRSSSNLGRLMQTAGQQ